LPLQQQQFPPAFLAQICCRHSRQQLKQLCPDNLQGGSASATAASPAASSAFHLGQEILRQLCQLLRLSFLPNAPFLFGIQECAGQGQLSLSLEI